MEKDLKLRADNFSHRNRNARATQKCTYSRPIPNANPQPLPKEEIKNRAPLLWYFYHHPSQLAKVHKTDAGLVAEVVFSCLTDCPTIDSYNTKINLVHCKNAILFKTATFLSSITCAFYLYFLCHLAVINKYFYLGITNHKATEEIHICIIYNSTTKHSKLSQSLTEKNSKPKQSLMPSKVINFITSPSLQKTQIPLLTVSIKNKCQHLPETDLLVNQSVSQEMELKIH